MSYPTTYQFLLFAVVVIAGVLISLALQYVFMQVILNPEKIARKAAARVVASKRPLDYKSLGHLGTGGQGWVGAIEIILYATAVFFKHPDFIGVWFATKYVAAYKTWAREPVGRTFYNRSLFGSGLNVLLGAATGGIALVATRDLGNRRLNFLWLWHMRPKGGSGMVQLILGALIAVMITIGVENLRRPRLSMFIEQPPYDPSYPSVPIPAPAKNARFLRVMLGNKPLAFWARWMERAPALQCRATITFREEHQNATERTMTGRWSSTPQPIPVPIMDLSGGVQFRIIDIDKMAADYRIDVYPGESERLDIAAQFDDESDCYGWNNESYFSNPPWRNANLRLAPGNYLVTATVSSSGRKLTQNFRLRNTGNRMTFSLEQL